MHGEMELLYNLQGRCAVFLEGKNFVLRPEDFVVFNPFSSHQVYREEGGHTLSLYLPINILTSTGTGIIACLSCLHPEKKVDNNLLRMWLAELYRDWKENSGQRKLNMQAELLELLSILQQNFSVKEENTPSLIEEISGKHERKQELLRYIWEHFREPITLESVAKEFYLSEGHLSRSFHKMAGESFSEYLKKLRLLHAEKEMELGKGTVTDIALSCGFGSVNTFIHSFRERYGETPGTFLRRKRKEEASRKYQREKADHQSVGQDISYMSLMKYRNFEKKDPFLRLESTESIRADLNGKRTAFYPIWRKIGSAGYAKDLLFEVVQSGLLRSVNEIRYEGFLFHGIFNDELGVCRRGTDGKLKYNFVYMDLILDFLVEKLQVIPWIFLDYTPACMTGHREIRQFGDYIMNLPENLSEWTQLITAVLEHMIEVYGKKQVSSWKFSMEQAMQVTVGNCEMEEYKQFYLVTYRTIRSVLPDAEIFGFGTDTGYVRVPGHRELEELLCFAKENNCLPDILGFQTFFCDYAMVEGKQFEYEITEDEVFPMSQNENILAEELQCINEIMKQEEIRLPKMIFASNFGMWGRAPGNDTCFRSAGFVKNMIENRNELIAFCTSSVSDYPERLLAVKSMYHGGSGLLTYNGIPKAAYTGIQLANEVRGEVVDEGEGYLLTCTADRREFYLLLYYYCPYDLSKCRRTVLSEEEERNYDRYYDFKDYGAKSVHIFLSGLLPGTYQLETRSVNRESGSSYDLWMKMGAPAQMRQSQLKYLEERSVCDLLLDTVHVEEEGDMVWSAFLEPHEVRVIHGMLDTKV